MLQRAGTADNKRINKGAGSCCRASLTVEAALVMPLFLFTVLTFIYFIQIFTLQEYIQATITKMGLNMAKTAYVYEDFVGIEDALGFDETIFGTELEIGLGDFAKATVDQSILGLYAKRYLDVDRINHSCIREGFEGISFKASKLLVEGDIIDIVVRYKAVLPFQVFFFQEIPLIQRVKVRAWTGYKVAATYSLKEEETKEDVVYITDTGSVYHNSQTCSHIHLSVTAIQGVPTTQRNDNGGKYYPCEKCCDGERNNDATYYITSDGTRYHTIRNCSKIKRSVKEILRSEVGNRPPCKRCGQ